MTRFKKEMMKKFPHVFCESVTGESGAYVVEEEALVVVYCPSLVTVLRVQRNGKQRDVSDDYPRLSAPYLVYLCGGDEEKAKEILKENHF